MRQSSKGELAEWGVAALEQLRGPVSERLRQRWARWRDPRARLLRQRRRAKVGSASGAVTTGTLGVGSYTSLSAEMFGLTQGSALEGLLDMAGLGFGGLAVATGAGTIGLGVRYFRLKRRPLPAPAPEPVSLPPPESAAREPMRKLRDAEQSLYENLSRLATNTVEGVGDPASDTRATASTAATALRQAAGKLRAVEGAMPHASDADRPTLQADVERLRSELDEGVEAYGGLVVAATRAVAASGAPEQTHVLQDATDRLAGLAQAWQELSTSAWDVATSDGVDQGGNGSRGDRDSDTDRR